MPDYIAAMHQEAEASPKLPALVFLVCVHVGLAVWQLLAPFGLPSVHSCCCPGACRPVPS